MGERRKLQYSLRKINIALLRLVCPEDKIEVGL